MKPVDRSQTIVVLGASGRVGRSVVMYLAGRGYRVKAACRNPERLEFDSAKVISQARLVIDEGPLVELCTGSAAVISAIGAKIPCYSRQNRDVHEFNRINVDALETIGGSIVRAGNMPLVHVGSMMAYGLETNGNIDEYTKFLPTSPFEKSEYQGEQRLIALGQQKGLDYRIARLPPVIGAEPSGGVFANLKLAAKHNDWREYFEKHAKTSKPIINSADMLSAIERLTNCDAPRSAYNFVSYHETLSQLVFAVDAVATQQLPTGLRRNDFEEFLRRFLKWNVSVCQRKVVADLGWRPQ